MRDEAKSLKQKPRKLDGGIFPHQTSARRGSAAQDSEVKGVSNAPDFDKETLTRKELGKLFNVSHEAIRIWEENGKLIELGWERIPHIKSPVKYSRTRALIDPVSAQE